MPLICLLCTLEKSLAPLSQSPSTSCRRQLSPHSAPTSPGWMSKWEPSKSDESGISNIFLTFGMKFPKSSFPIDYFYFSYWPNRWPILNSTKALSKAINSPWIIVGVSEATMLSSKLATVGKKDPRGEQLWGDISLSGCGIRFCPSFVLCRRFAEGHVWLCIWNWCGIRRAQVALVLTQQLLSARHALSLVSHKHKTLFKTSWSFPS